MWRRVIAGWLAVFVGLVSGPSWSAVPVIIPVAMEVITASGAVVPISTAGAGTVGGASVGVVGLVGTVMAYLALTGADGSRIAIPGGPGTAQGVPVPTAPATVPSGQGALCWGMEPACFGSWQEACVAWGGQVADFGCRKNDQMFSMPSYFGSSCPAGYSLAGSGCVLVSPQAVAPDQRCDVKREGMTMSYYSDDPDCSTASSAAVLKGSITGDKWSVAGTTPEGRPTVVSVQATPTGTTITTQSQGTDGAGNSTVTTQTITVDNGGQVSSGQVQTQPGSVNTSTGTTTTTGEPQQQTVVKELLCTVFPNISACQELGTASQQPAIPEVEVSGQVEARPVRSGVYACPAPQSFQALGQTHQLSWQPFCSLAEGVRPIVLALAWIGVAVGMFGRM